MLCISFISLRLTLKFSLTTRNTFLYDTVNIQIRKINFDQNRYHGPIMTPFNKNDSIFKDIDLLFQIK